MGGREASELLSAELIVKTTHRDSTACPALVARRARVKHHLRLFVCSYE